MAQIKEQDPRTFIAERILRDVSIASELVATPDSKSVALKAYFRDGSSKDISREDTTMVEDMVKDGIIGVEYIPGDDFGPGPQVLLNIIGSERFQMGAYRLPLLIDPARRINHVSTSSRGLSGVGDDYSGMISTRY